MFLFDKLTLWITCLLFYFLFFIFIFTAVNIRITLIVIMQKYTFKIHSYSYKMNSSKLHCFKKFAQHKGNEILIQEIIKGQFQGQM